MNVVMFAYTICLILTCAAAAVFASASYVVSHRRSLVPQIGFFVFYILDLLSIFGYEWSSQNLPFDPATYYEIENPILRTAISAGVLFCLWLMLLDLLDVHDRMTQVVPPVLFFIASGLILLTMPHDPLRQWLYFTMRQVFVAYALLYAFRKWYVSDDEVYRNRLARYKKRYLVLCALLIAILLEDTYVILIAPIPTKSTSWLLLYLSSRNFSENLMMLFVAYFCCKANVELLALRLDAPPTANDSGSLERHLDNLLPTYARRKGLSPRETEVLGLVLEGKDNRTIAQELFLAEGTIKTHIHNIMKKTGTSSREELKKDFWSV